MSSGLPFCWRWSPLPRDSSCTARRSRSANEPAPDAWRARSAPAGVPYGRPGARRMASRGCAHRTRRGGHAPDARPGFTTFRTHLHAGAHVSTFLWIGAALAVFLFAYLVWALFHAEDL